MIAVPLSIYAPAWSALRARLRAARQGVPLPRADVGGDGPAAAPAGYRVERGAAVLPVYGPTYRHETAMNTCAAELFGGVSYNHLAREIDKALADPAVRSLVLDIDSPGGEAIGAGQLAAKVRAASQRKPVTAFVSGLGASAAYYLAAAAPAVVADPGAILGSIGTVIELVDDTGFQEATGIKDVTVVSDQSPYKWPDPSTEAGRLEYRRLATDLAQVFIDDVARYRSTTPLRVMEDFGAGGVLVGAEAVQVGLADRLGTLDDAIALASQPARGPSPGFHSLRPAAAGRLSPVAARRR